MSEKDTEGTEAQHTPAELSSRLRYFLHKKEAVIAHSVKYHLTC